MVKFSIKPDDQTDKTATLNLVKKTGLAKSSTKLFFISMKIFLDTLSIFWPLSGLGESVKKRKLFMKIFFQKRG